MPKALDLESSEIRKYQESVKISYNNRLEPSRPAKMKILLRLEKNLVKQKLNFSRSALFVMKIRVSLKHFVNDCLWKHLFASNSPHTPSFKFKSFANLGNSKA